MKSWPHSIDAEKALLASIFLKPSILDEAKFSADLFYIPAHQIIFRYLSEVYSDTGEINFVVFKNRMHPNELAETGGVESLKDLFCFVPSCSGWRHYLQIVLDKHVRRTIKSAAAQIDQRMDDEDGDPNVPVREVAEKALMSLMSKGHEVKEVYLYEHIARRLDEAIAGKNGHYTELTGIRALNLALGGVSPGEQIVIAAETSFGKTALALHIATHVALGPQKRRVAIFSFEMSVDDLTDRIISCCSEVPLKALRYSEFTREHLSKADKWRSGVKKEERTINLVEGYSFDITEIISQCRRMKATGQLDMVIVDYLQLVNPAITRESNRQREIADVSRRLKVMAEELRVIVVALSQLNDEGKLRESRAIGQDADVILIIEEGKSDDAFERIIKIGKSRNGQRGAKVPVHFYGDYVKFCDKS